MKIYLAAVLATGLLAGCSLGGDEGASDKAGGSDAPVLLSMAYPYNPREGQPDEPALRYFAARVAELSDGGMRVRISFNAAGEVVPDAEARVARMVRSGKVDLGWIATRVWDQLGVKSFQALQAPFLISDDALLGRVAESPLADEMLSSLSRLGLSGLAIVPELLRHPMALRDPLVSVEDFDGARIRDIPSKATDALLSALGATPVHVSNASFGREISRGHIDGAELPTSSARGGWTVSANVTFFGKANTVVANAEALERLTAEQRDVLMRAAEQTARHAVEVAPSEREMARKFCAAGRIAIASPAQLRALRHATQSVYEELEREARTRSLIARIGEMKRSRGEVADRSPAPCGHAVQPSDETEAVRSPNRFDGTYRWHLTAEGARRAGMPGDPDIGSVVTMTMRGGRWLLGTDPHYSGTFEATGNRLVFDWPSEGAVLTFTFRRGESGLLDVKPVLPMDRGDQFVWASAPWQRVGPPVRDVP